MRSTPASRRASSSGDAAHDVLGVVEARVRHRLCRPASGPRSGARPRCDAALSRRHERASLSRTEWTLSGGARGHGLAVAGDERVEDDDLVAGEDELLDGDAADVAGAAGDEDAHQRPRSRSRNERRACGITSAVESDPAGPSVTIGRSADPRGAHGRALHGLPAGGQDLREPRLHAPCHVVLRVDAQRPRRQLVGGAVIAVGERAARQADDRDGVARDRAPRTRAYSARPARPGRR